MEILVLVQDYPSNDRQYTMNFVHTRNIEYERNGVNVTVLSFQASNSYEYESITVFSEEDFFKENKEKYFDLIISHAPNVRNHIRFLNRHKKMYNHLIMFFHGHEVMKMSKYYPKPYEFEKEEKTKKVMHDIYDSFKLKVLKAFISSELKKDKLKMVFVSEWMKNVFLENVKLKRIEIEENSFIIPNTMNNVFLMKNYAPNVKPLADFVTIRPLDKPKYAIDVVVKLAKKNPDLTFHIYGKGRFFKYYSKPKNVQIFDKFMEPHELAEMLNYYKCALMPTRLDAQGVMMCEIATYGMPVVTSDISICKEVLSSFNNVFYFNNENLNINLKKVLESINLNNISADTKEAYSLENTIHKELHLFNSLLNNKKS